MTICFLRSWFIILLCAVVVGPGLNRIGFSQDAPTAGGNSGVLHGHVAPVLMGVFTPDGERAVTVSSDESVRLWDLATGKEIRQYNGHTGPLYCAAISGDGRTLVTGAQDNTLRLWDVPQPRPVLSLTGHQGVAGGLAISPDGNLVVSGAADKTVRLWNLSEVSQSIAAKKPQFAAGSDYSLRSGHREAVTAAAWRNDAAYFATGDADGRVLVWSPYLDVVQGGIGQHAGGVTGLAFPTNNQQLISTGGDGVIRFWQLPIPTKRDLAGVTAAVTGIAIPTNQPTAIVGAADGTLRLFDVNSGQVAREFPKSDRLITSVAVQPNNSLICVADDVGRLRLLNFGDGVERGSVAAHDKALSQVAFHPDNQRFATAGSEGTVKQWTIDSIINQKEGEAPQPERLWEGLTGGATAIVYTANGASVFGAGKDRKIRQWKAADGALERTLEGHTGEVTELAVTPNGQQLLSASADKTLRVWNPADGSLVRSIEHPTALRSVTVRSDSLRAAAFGDDGQVRVWDLATGVLLQSFESHAKDGTGVRWLSDGITLVSGAKDQSLVAAKTSIIRAITPHGKSISDMAMYAGGGQVVTCSPDSSVVMTDVNSGNVVRKFEGLAGEPKCVATRADNQRVAAGTSDGKVFVWNAGNAQLLQTIEVGSPVTRLAYSPDNQKLAAVDEKNTLRIFGPVIPPNQPQSGIELFLHQEVVTAQPLTRIEFSRDNRSVWATQADGQVTEWAYASPVQLRQFNHGGPVYSVAISRDGKTVVSGSTDQTIRIWDATTGQQKFQLNGHVGAVHAVALSADESLIVSAGADNSIRLWDVAGGRQLKQLATLSETMYSVAVHPNGQTIAAAGADRKVHLFDLLTGAEKLTMEGHTDYIHCVAFNPQGTRLLSYGYAGQLRVWNPADGKPLFEQRVGSIGNYANYAADGSRTLLSNGDGTARVFEIPAAAR
ncbi:hypothetical protein GC176_02585 [bacterium]|nr:hypothetical protein [bacterium]